MKSNVRLIGIFASLALLCVFVFQNCSETNFSKGQSSSCEGDCDPKPQSIFTGTISSETVYPRADILFVIDESSSMKEILSQVRKGFASIAENSNEFPPDTKMAVTYMAPANIKSGAAQNTKPWIVQQKKSNYPTHISYGPGFLKLVNSGNIKSFKNKHPNNNAFKNAGCATSWFRPDEKNNDGDLCLEGHIQAPFVGTGVEAGAVSLKQLVEKMNGNNRELFRRDSVANVIFVSDTHDPGQSNYYGKAGAPKNIIGYGALKSLIEDNSKVKSLKFHAIAPMPTTANHAALDGVKVIGDLPKKSKITGEDLHSFNYLDFVGKSGGSAMPPNTKSDWGEAIKEMVGELGKVKNEKPIVELDKAIQEIEQVYVNGVKMQPQNYEVLADERSVMLHLSYLPEENEVWTVEIQYIPY